MTGLVGRCIGSIYPNLYLISSAVPLHHHAMPHLVLPCLPYGLPDCILVSVLFAFVLCIQSCSASSPTHAYTHRERDVYLHINTEAYTPRRPAHLLPSNLFSITTSRPLPRASQADIGLRNWTSSIQTHNCRDPAKLCLNDRPPLPDPVLSRSCFGPTVAGRSASLPPSFPLGLSLKSALRSPFSSFPDHPNRPETASRLSR